MSQTTQRVVNATAVLMTLLTATSAALGLEESPAASLDEPVLEEADREYWAYQPVVRPTVPVVENAEWSVNPIDCFILSRLEKNGLKPVAPAGGLALLRRVTFDLTGLPPTLDEIESCLNAPEDAAYPAIVKRLLSSSAYGERWAQHWLDLVRFAETDGYEHDKVRPEAWRYRDWVINALNEDLPYDEFVQHQLAGDELRPGDANALIATGYLMAGPDMPDINLQEERRHNFLNGMTANVGEVFLGLRFACAQCHHHRTDPISQHDFYRLRAFFETIDLFKETAILNLEAEEALSPGGKPKSSQVVRNISSVPKPSHLWIRGDFRRPGPELVATYPRVLSPAESESAIPADTKHRRTELARWLTSRDNPLTARVMVNRIWQHHFGKGLIGTPSDFGWMGDSASHPELLDWLAAEFMESGWSMKRLHELIVTSKAYQLASKPDSKWTAEQLTVWDKLVTKDSSNKYLGRQNRRRLEGEAIRDAILSVSGDLNTKAGGPGVRPPLPQAVASSLLKNQWPVTQDTSDHSRRSIYLFARRNLRMPILESFDKPDTNLSCPDRSQTTIAPQALHLLNSEFAREQAHRFARRVQNLKSSDEERIQVLYGLALGRPATADEIAACVGLIETDQSLVDVCHAVLNLNEFVYID